MGDFTISKLTRTLIIAIILIAISSCSFIADRPKPTRDEIEQIGFGAEPTKRLYQSMIKDYLDSFLGSAHAVNDGRLSLPVKVYDNEDSHPLLVGYLVCIDVDFKNESDASVQKVTYGFLLRDREILKKYSNKGSYREKQIISICSYF